MSPELIMKTIYEPEKVDVFSIGVLAYVFRAATFPFSNADIYEDKNF